MAKKIVQPQKTSKLNRKINRPIADTQQIEAMQ